MCGLCGKLVFDGSLPDVGVLEAMNATLTHRGPDDEGIHIEPGIGLGERRLSVIDIRSIATAPLPNEDRTIWVVFNGEIYNFRELRAQLVSRGHVFRTSGDTEVLVHLYEEMGF